ncbi:uncharacterized protein LOC128769769 [Synchiropus splendidus]|uniref:uncharacterized protein LOC128769769 n=1 Tax=Synchiropus splendidus TaxID=270530 RepID=UPI00237ECE5A|nr:uncharacterized protein LOC128769769 [Synchiropus splendidus]
MARSFVLTLLGLTLVLRGTEGVSEICRGARCLSAPSWTRPCVGAHCPGRTEPDPPAASSRLFQHFTQARQSPVYQQDAQYSHHTAPLPPYVQPHQGFTQQDGTRRTNPRTLTAEVFHPGCAGGTCPTSVSQHQTSDDSTRECKGFGCKLRRQKPNVCSGDGCFTRVDDAHNSPVHVTDRAAQFLDELPEFGSERGARIQLTCDMKSGNNEVPAEDALVLQLELSKSQEAFVEALKGQQVEVKELQRLLSEQQGALVSQQREILEQQRRMYEQMEQVKSQYNLLMDSIKQTSLHNVQEEMDSHIESLTSQDRDECLELSDLCGDQQKCLNTPGGFRCHGMTEREATLGMCGLGYFFNSDMDECQACHECDGEPMASPCTFTMDAVCSGPAAADSPLSLSWSGDVSLPGGKNQIGTHSSPGVKIHIQGRSEPGLVSAEDGHLVLRQHGLVWLDENMAVTHGCRSFIQVCLRLNDTAGSDRLDLSGVRVEQREVKSLQSVSISGVAEVSPGHAISLYIQSASQHCNQSNEGLQLYTPTVAPLSLLWLSHDTGAVAMTAQATVTAHYHTTFRPVFRTTSTSDPYVVGLTHDGRGVRFAESGTVRFVFQQAFYSMGQACVAEGFQLLAYVNRNGTGMELSRAFKPGVHYRDTSISLSGATQVGSGDTLAFEILSPGQCNVRYFGDETGISILSLVWVPAAISTSLFASVANTGLPSGAVRNKPLFFQQTSPQVAQMGLSGKGSADHARDFVFRESGSVSVALDLKLIHSCSLIKVTLLRRSDPQLVGDGARPVPVAQQVAGQIPEGSQWASVSLRVSFQVHNGTAVFFVLDCVRGRVNQISHHAGSGVSLMWVAAA